MQSAQRHFMQFLRTPFLRLAVVALACLSLTACIELVPRDVKENIVIQRDGRIEVTYEGSFNDLSDLAQAIAADTKDKKMPSAEEFRAEALALLKDKLKISEVEDVSPGVYRLRWHDAGTLSEGKLPKLLDHYGNEELPRLLYITKHREISSAAFGIESSPSDDPEEMPSMPEGKLTSKVVRGYLDRFQGKVSIRVDPSMVLKHNATSVSTDSEGMLVLQWSLSMPPKQRVDLLVTLDKRDFPVFKLMNSPQGSNCKELIGTDCKCGPFTFVNHQGTVLANAPYEIEGPQGKKAGCTNAEGKTEAILSPVTGPCRVTLLSADEAGACVSAAAKP